MSNFTLSDNWVYIKDESIKTGLLNEALGEMSVKHDLVEKLSHAIATCENNDDVLFELINGDYAIVHLTWNGHESDPAFPAYRLCRKKELNPDFFVEKP